MRRQSTHEKAPGVPWDEPTPAKVESTVETRDVWPKPSGGDPWGTFTCFKCGVKSAGFTTRVSRPEEGEPEAAWMARCPKCAAEGTITNGPLGNPLSIR
jgi:hypothetical protein